MNVQKIVRRRRTKFRLERERQRECRRKNGQVVAWSCEGMQEGKRAFRNWNTLEKNA